MSTLQWERAPYGIQAWFADVAGIGRYLIRREHKGSRLWRLVLNGKPTEYTGSSQDEVKLAAERAVNQVRALGALSRVMEGQGR